MLSENTTQERIAHSVSLLYKVHWVGETELYCLEMYCLNMVLKFKKITETKVKISVFSMKRGARWDFQFLKLSGGYIGVL